jgi:hypothetical protein
MGQVAEEFLHTVLVSGKNAAKRQAREIDEWLGPHAPWKDDTGDARRGLHAFVDETAGPIGTIVISHDPLLDYTIWLEIANQGRYSIIRPALDYWAPKTKASLQSLVNLGLISMGSKTRRKR